MTKGLWLVLSLLLLPLQGVLAQQAGLPHWMAGVWMSKDGDAWGEEYWTPPRGGIMIGAARNGVGDELEFWEQSRILIKVDGSISFFAQPKGAPAVEFPMVLSGDAEIIFANPEHDYPQRIRYWREGSLLKAEISLADGANAYYYVYHPYGSK